MMKECYNMLADEKELRWFFDHAIFKPLPYESYTMVFVARHKKLTDEECKEFGVTRREAEWMQTQIVRPPKFSALNKQYEPWKADNFIKHVRRFNVDKEAYTTSTGVPIPEKTLAIIFYVNPADDIKVADEIIRQIEDTKTCMAKALTNPKKDYSDIAHMYLTFSNLENNFKHFKAHCKGSKFWMDFDVDVSPEFKEKCYNDFYNITVNRFGKGNFLIVDTSGGYHILVRTCAIFEDPHKYLKDVEALYKDKVKDNTIPEYEKFEAIMNASQIPGIPLPGTYQYGRCVRVVNKSDYDSVKPIAATPDLFGKDKEAVIKEALRVPGKDAIEENEKKLKDSKNVFKE